MACSLFRMDCHCSQSSCRRNGRNPWMNGSSSSASPSDSGMKNRFKPTLSASEIFSSVPRLGTLEKISEALNVGLNRFFIPESDGEALLEDPFIQGLRPFLRQLDWEQWQSILKRLQAISDHV